MSWFDEQLRYREQSDQAGLHEAIDSIAGAVMGKRLRAALDEREIANSALGEILKYYHVKPKNEELPPQIKTVEEQIRYQTRPFGIMNRAVELDAGWYRHAAGAMLGTLKEDGSAVALIPGRFSGYRFWHPQSGKWVRLNARTEQLLEREALCFYQPLPLKALTVRDLIQFMVEQMNISDIVLCLSLMGVSAALGLLAPLFNKWLFGEVLNSGSQQMLLALACFMVGFSLCQLCFSAFQSLAVARINIKQNIAVQAAVMNRIMSLPASFFKQYAAGELTQRADYVQALSTSLFNILGLTGLTSLFSLIYIGQIFAFAPALVVPSLLIILSTLLLTLLTTFLQMKITREKMELSARISGLTYSTISGIQKIKLAGAETRMFSRWGRGYAKEAALEYNPPAFLKLSPTLNLAVTLLGTLLLYALAIKSEVSIANYYAFNTAYSMLSSAFMALASIAATVGNIKPMLEMARPIMEARPEMEDGREIVTRLRGDIELNHVSFRYDEKMPNVIDDLSLKIHHGEYVALVGSTGCGKSTLMRLLLGFEQPQKGNIFYDRKDMQRLDLESLRRQIGVVMQDGKLFLGDIYSNITIAAPHLSLDEAWQAAAIAALDEDIRQMPMGMHTVISEGQGGISGGQKQRLMIARAVAPKPRILMFDEATSALDNLTQKKVTEAIAGLNCTRIVIAHRLSTVSQADRIIFLHQGKIAEEGTYAQLIAKNGLFAQLVARQRLDIDTD